MPPWGELTTGEEVGSLTSVATGEEKTISGRLTLRLSCDRRAHHLTTDRAPVAVLPPDPECGRPRPPHSGHNPLRCGRGQLTLNAEKMMLGTTGSPSGFFTIKPRPGADPE